MADERAELAELRRLDALEVKAKGGNAAAPVADDPVTREARDLQGTTTAELIAANPIVRTLTGAAEPVLGAAGLMEKAVTGRNTNAERVEELHKMQSRGAKALNYGGMEQGAADLAGAVMSPGFLGSAKYLPAAKSAIGRIAQGSGIGALSDLTTPDEGTRTGGKGAATGAAIAGAVEGATKLRGVPRFISSIADRFRGKPEPSKPADEGASRVISEAQRQRDVMAGKKGVPAGKSQVELATKDFEESMRPLREAAFNEAKRIDAADTLSFIQKLKDKNPDAQVQAALREAEGTIQRAAKGAQTASLPSAGARMTPADLKRLQGQGQTFDVAMADEVRQSLNRQIEQRGDKALSKHTQDLLGQVRDRIVSQAPASYRSYLDAYAKGASELDKVRGAAVLDKLTSGERTVESLPAGDAQNALEAVFSGKTPGRDMTALVGAMKHNPEAAASLRRSFGEWLTKRDAVKGITEPGDLLKRWEHARDAVQKSGLFDAAHAQNITKAMDDMRSQTNASAGSRASKYVAGWLVGARFGHPWAGAHAATEVSKEAATREPLEAITSAIEQASLRPEVAKALAADATAENIQRFEQLMAVETGKGREEPKPQGRSRLRQLIGTEMR